MSVFQGDFLGFTLGDIHSSNLNITRVSSSDRYEDTLLPTFKDVTVEMPSGDGTYYLNTFYNSRTFNIDFAYDNLHDEDIRVLRQILGFKGVKQLIFDEYSYKKYMVKCAAPPSLKYICFDDHDVRIYKGEGSISLIAYYPFAIGVTPVVLNNVSNTFISNEGDIETDLKIYFPTTNLTNLNFVRIKDNQNNILNYLTFTNMEKIGADEYILIDSSTHLIEGLDVNFKKTGHLYNTYISGGDFFKIPPGPLGQFRYESSIPATKIEYNLLYY